VAHVGYDEPTQTDRSEPTRKPLDDWSFAPKLIFMIGCIILAAVIHVWTSKSLAFMQSLLMQENEFGNNANLTLFVPFILRHAHLVFMVSWNNHLDYLVTHIIFAYALRGHQGLGHRHISIIHPYICALHFGVEIMYTLYQIAQVSHL
ncbi:hypothetical protein ACJX0J_016514, partial [Zea mays]